MTGYTLNDVGGRLPWSALSSFIDNLQVNSALFREMTGMKAGWDSTLKTNIILADLVDVVNAIAHGLSGKKHKVKPYPRPFEKGKDKEEKHIGKGALATVDDLRNWIKEKRNGR